MTSQERTSCLPHPITSVTTEFYADSTEWCPIEQFEKYFVCGTYQLNDGNSDNEVQARQGDISLYEVIQDPNSAREYKMKRKCQMQTSGILDMKWSPRDIGKACILGVAMSDGYIQLLQIRDENTGLTEFISLDRKSISSESGTLALSLDWSSWKYDCQTSIVVSDSGGCLNLINVDEAEISVGKKWKAHNFEAWIAAFDYDNTKVMYSGGDDCYFKSWDLRTSLSSASFLSKRHSMGVTSIQKSKSHEFMLATGSYDESIIIWDARSMRIPLLETNVGGGVWRIKWHPLLPQYLLVAAMHSGFHVLEVQDSKIATVASYMGHSSLAYGVDWTPIKSQDFTKEYRNLVSSCSFYDKSLQLWSISLK